MLVNNLIFFSDIGDSLNLLTRLVRLERSMHSSYLLYDEDEHEMNIIKKGSE